MTTKSTPLKLSENDRERLKKLGVGILYLFGSRAEGRESDGSDFDFGVVMENPILLKEDTNPVYLALFELLGRYVGDSNNLDILFLQKTPLELRFDVIRHGQPLFEISEDFRLSFEEVTMRDYCDFKPLLREFDQAILSHS